MLNEEIREYIDRSVLCWLATASVDGQPNVSPKEAFKAFGDDSIIIANIASPQSWKNIQENNLVCLSFIDVFLQKGFQLKGTAEIVSKEDASYSSMASLLEEMLKGQYPYETITRIRIAKVKKIIAPRYYLYPETTEADQIASAKMTYGVH